MPMSVAGVDIGFGWTNAMATGKDLRIPSVIGIAQSLFDSPNDKAKGISIWHGEREYFVGTLAIQQSEQRFFSLKEDKADSFISEVLLLASIGYLSRGNEEISLVTGLPVDFYFKQRARLTQLIEQCNDTLIKMQIDGQLIELRSRITRHKAVPQPLGALMSVVLSSGGEIVNKTLAAKSVLVVDIGTYTCNLLAVNGLEIIQPLSKTLPLGLHVAYKTISRELGGAPVYEVDAKIVAGRIRGYEKTLQALAEQITFEVEGINTDFDVYLIAGGGGAQLIEWLLPGRNPEIVPDPQGAICRGYRNLGARLWKQRL